MKTIKQHIIKYLLFILVLGLFTNGCFCPSPDYTKEIKEILNPVSQSLEDFYTENQRFPDTSERNKILEDRGCLFGDKGEGYCRKFGVWFTMRNNLMINPSSDYKLYISYKEVVCRIVISSDNGKNIPICKMWRYLS